MAQPVADVSERRTIAIAGFPPDASLREMRNLCKLCPGFERAQPRVAPGRPMILFAKFESAVAAMDCIFQLQDYIFDEENNHKLKAEFAKGEMYIPGETRIDNQRPEGHAPVTIPALVPPPPPMARASAAAEPAVKRPRTISPPPSARVIGAVVRKPVPPPPARTAAVPAVVSSHPPRPHGMDTLACKVPPDQSGAEVMAYFQHLPGFMGLTDNGKNCFVKFDSPISASDGMDCARVDGFVCDFARSSMPLPTPGPELGVETEDPMASAEGDQQDDESPVDTLACKAVGVYEEDLQEFFEGLPGFVRLKYNVKNCFVKFESTEFATDALAAAREFGFTVAFARFSL